MAFDPLEERRKGQRGMLDLFGSSPLSGGGMLSAAGMPPMRQSRPDEWWQWASTQPGYNVGIKPQPLPIPSQPSHSDEWWQAVSQLPGYNTSHGGIYQSDTGRPEARPPFVPADCVYIGMGDWGPPPEQTVPGAEYGPTYIDGQPNAWAGPDAFYPNWGDPADATYGNDVAIGNWVPPPVLPSDAS